MERLWNKKRELLLLASIVAVAAFLRFFRLGGQSLWTDEMFSLGACKSPPGVSFWRKITWDVHGPLHSLILHFWSNLSKSDAWLRAPSAIVGVLSVFFLYKWLVILKRRDLALIGALFLALSPFNLYYSQELRFYSLLNMFVIVSLIYFTRFLASPSLGRGAVLGVILALTCLSHFSGVFLCLAFLVYLVITRRLRGRCLRSGALAAFIVLLIVSPWVYREITFLGGIRVVDISTIPVGERLRGELTLSVWSYPYALYAFSVGYSFGPSLQELHLIDSALELLRSHALEILMTIFLFGGLILSGFVRSAREKRLALFLTVVIVSVISVTVITMLNIKVFNVRYLTSAFPVFITLIVFGLPSGKLEKYALVVAVAAIMLISDWNYHFVPRYARDDIKGAVNVIMEFEDEGDLILVLVPGVVNVFKYYYTGSNKIEAFHTKYVSRERIEDGIKRCAEVYPRIWYVRCRHWDNDRDDMLLMLLSSEDLKVESWEFSGVLVNLFRRRVE
ncbi:MAG: glycosyltransferase family 39 protein [Candidatus Krumholzibacteria bacterium]|nr:glycosyltransferase family 39 protein [Candidatus Krumholzibacteria bacterium]